ncbi:uncharacterized protein LOC134528609 [Bacillus rossius redtenbacheri]|uniref:uncharacterized protein LOC134528609 n=1 Tax=Bacillus rossius redtenbacheri TaxID=93214 RepID=UPI002FDD6F64
MALSQQRGRLLPSHECYLGPRVWAVSPSAEQIGSCQDKVAVPIKGSPVTRRSLTPSITRHHQLQRACRPRRPTSRPRTSQRLTARLMSHLMGRLMSHLMGRLMSHLMGRLMSHLMGRLMGHLMGRLMSHLMGRLMSHLMGRLMSHLMGRLMSHLMGRLMSHLMGHLMDHLMGRTNQAPEARPSEEELTLIKQFSVASE